ncbi:MAG: DUF4278 domain-containing protein [Cyanobacteria bacterium J06638_38]
MELHFLGQVYSTNDIQIETVASDIKAHFRGQTYHLRRPLTNFKSQFGIRKYRGILYTKS